MDDKPTDRLGLRGRMMILTALQTTYDRDTAFDIAQKSDDLMLKIVAVATADYATATTLMHDLQTLHEKRDGTPADNARRWQRRLDRALWIVRATARTRPRRRESS